MIRSDGVVVFEEYGWKEGEGPMVEWRSSDTGGGMQEREAPALRFRVMTDDHLLEAGRLRACHADLDREEVEAVRCLPYRRGFISVF